MKKALVVILALALVVAVLAITGCGGDDEVVETPFGDVTVEEGNGSVTIETEEGNITAEGGEREPTENELNAPIYPDAEYVDGSGYAGTVSDETGSFSSAGAEWTTSDSLDDVVGFYTDELGEPMAMMDGEATWILGDPTGDDVTTVLVEESGGETRITIGRLVTE